LVNRATWVGLSLLAVLFVISAWRVVVPRSGFFGGDEKVVRFAHYRLERPIIDALDAIARDYERLHPGVRVEQITVPLRGWRAWLNTQLVGEMAPDLVYLYGFSIEMFPRHFHPLTRAVEEPNPYNRGTHLEGVPWRDTFLDGLASSPNYQPSLQEYYGIPLSMATWRLLYNRELLWEVTGSPEPPRSFREFVEVRERTEEYRRRTGRVVLPIAGSADRTLPAMDRLFQSQTQRLGAEINWQRQIVLGFTGNAVSWLRGMWNFDSPGVRGGLELWREFGRAHQPGFLQSQQEDATFLFLQQRALMVAVISWDYRNLRELAPFVVGVTGLPFATPDDPEFGANTFGHISEAGLGLLFSFGLTRYGEHPEVALDFLRYLTSAEGNARFSARSGNLPALFGVPADEDLAEFVPRIDGSPAGVRLVRGPPRSGDATNRLVETELHRLMAEHGSVDHYVEEMNRRYGTAVRFDLRRQARDLLRRSAQEDSILAVLEIDPGADPRGQSLRWENQTAQELEAAMIDHALATSAR
jgi:raffinose/stachyose/melibiose transport system substrate-binding protein